MSAPAWAEAAARKDALILQSLAECPDWLPTKIESRLMRAFGCLIWQGSISKGYGLVGLPRTVAPPLLVSVHRAVYIASTGGPIPYGLTLDHLCQTRACGDASHLEPVTVKVNTSRSNHKSTHTHCPRGHSIVVGDPDAELVPSMPGRTCRRCNRENSRRQQAAIKAAREHLGLTHADYTAAYGHSRRVAEAVLRIGRSA